jgi:peptidoglycan/LPS O-acetylase OafA/YrhL
VLIGSALAAAIETGTSDFRSNVADVAVVLYLVATAVAVLLLAALLWRLMRPQGRRDRRRSSA